jgi:hypothetical protein
MKTKSMYVLAVTFLFAVASMPLYAGEYHPMSDPVYTPQPAFETSITGELESGIVESGGIAVKGESNEFCQYDWETKAFGDKRAVQVCMHPRHNLGGG